MVLPEGLNGELVVFKLIPMISESILFLQDYWPEGFHSLLAVVQRLPSVPCIMGLLIVQLTQGRLLHHSTPAKKD